LEGTHRQRRRGLLRPGDQWLALGLGSVRDRRARKEAARRDRRAAGRRNRNRETEKKTEKRSLLKQKKGQYLIRMNTDPFSVLFPFYSPNPHQGHLTMK